MMFSFVNASRLKGAVGLRRGVRASGPWLGKGRIDQGILQVCGGALKTPCRGGCILSLQKVILVDWVRLGKGHAAGMQKANCNINSKELEGELCINGDAPKQGGRPKSSQTLNGSVSGG